MKNHILKLGSNALVYGVGGLLSRFISFLLLPLFTAYLTPQDYGVAGMMATFNLVITPLAGLGLGVSAGLVYFEKTDPAKKAATIWTALVLLSLASVVLFSLSAVFARPLSQLFFQTPRYGHYVMLSALSTCLFNTLASVTQMHLQFEQRAKTFVLLNLASSLIGIALSVFLIVFLKRGVLGLLESNVLAPLVMVPVYAWQLRRLPFGLRKTVASELLRLGLPMIPSSVFMYALMQSSRYLLQHFHGLAEVGIYSIGFNLGMVVDIVVSAFCSAWYPFFMSFINDQQKAAPIFARVVSYYILGVGALVLLFFVASRPLVMIMTQPAFHMAYQVIGWTAAAMYFRGVFIALTPPVYFAKEVRMVALAQGLSFLLSIGIGWLLIPQGRILGAAVALAAGLFSLPLLQALWNRVRRRDYLAIPHERRRLGLFAVFFLVFAVIFSLPRRFSLTVEILASLTASVLLITLLALLLNPEEKITLLGAGRRVLKLRFRDILSYFPTKSPRT